MGRAAWKTVRVMAEAFVACVVVALVVVRMQGTPRETGVASVLLLIALVLGMILWAGAATRLRRDPGICGRCGYDLAGLPRGSVCPECGRADEELGV